jgi:hypothetical protein
MLNEHRYGEDEIGSKGKENGIGKMREFLEVILSWEERRTQERRGCTDQICRTLNIGSGCIEVHEMVHNCSILREKLFDISNDFLVLVNSKLQSCDHIA